MGKERMCSFWDRIEHRQFEALRSGKRREGSEEVVSQSVVGYHSQLVTHEGFLFADVSVAPGLTGSMVIDVGM